MGSAGELAEEPVDAAPHAAQAWGPAIRNREHLASTQPIDPKDLEPQEQADGGESEIGSGQYQTVAGGTDAAEIAADAEAHGGGDSSALGPAAVRAGAEAAGDAAGATRAGSATAESAGVAKAADAARELQNH